MPGEIRVGGEVLGPNDGGAKPPGGGSLGKRPEGVGIADKAPGKYDFAAPRESRVEARSASTLASARPAGEIVQLDGDESGLQRVLHALVDDKHDELPLERHSIFDGFATVAARSGIRYPLESEIAMDHLPPEGKLSERDLSQLHTEIETAPTDSGEFNTQLPASTLRAARRLVVSYAEAQQNEHLRHVDTDALLGFLDRQIEQYKTDLVALGQPGGYSPREYDPTEILAGTQEVDRTVELCGMRKMNPLSVHQRDGYHIIEYGSDGPFNFDAMKTITLIVEDGKEVPAIYGGRDHNLLVHGKGGEIKKLQASPDVKVTVRDLNVAYIVAHAKSDVNIDTSVVESLFIEDEARASIENSVVHSAIVGDNYDTATYPFISAHSSQIGRLVFNDSLGKLKETDIGTILANGTGRTIIKGEIVNLTIAGPDQDLRVDGHVTNYRSMRTNDVVLSQHPEHMDMSEGAEVIINEKRFKQENSTLMEVTPALYEG